MGAKRAIKYGIILPTVKFVIDVDVECSQQVRKCGVKVIYIKDACGTSGWDGEYNVCMFEKYGVGVTGKGIGYGVVEGVKHGALRHCGQVSVISG